MSRPALGLLAVVATCTLAPRVHARSAGIAAEGCNGCHGGGAPPAITIELSPEAPKPGETATLTVSIPTAGAAGFYLRTNGKGTLTTLAGQGTRLIDATQIVHASPKPASGGVSRFSMRWTAPSTPGGFAVDVWGVAANGDSASKGDGASDARAGFAIGCVGKTYFRDVDGDGVGGAETTVDCAKPAGFAEKGGDCDDYDANAYPGAPELCNGRDDDCDGTIDEDLEERTQYEDADGDGFGKSSGATVVARCPPKGYAPVAGDCDDEDPAIHPGAVETCNHHDDDCDGRVDERVRPICGVGMCAREAPTCDPATCEPGQPKTETCNGLDDDCDDEVDEVDEVDEGDLCPAGQVCRDAECVPGTAAPDAGGAAPGPATSGGCAIAAAGGAPSRAWWTALLVLACALARYVRGCFASASAKSVS